MTCSAGDSRLMTHTPVGGRKSELLIPQRIRRSRSRSTHSLSTARVIRKVSRPNFSTFAVDVPQLIATAGEGQSGALGEDQAAQRNAPTAIQHLHYLSYLTSPSGLKVHAPARCRCGLGCAITASWRLAARWRTENARLLYGP